MENSWQPYLKSVDDVWSQKTDRAERRRAQNRLAQRAKRARKARKPAVQQTRQNDEKSGPSANANSSDEQLEIVQADSKTDNPINKKPYNPGTDAHFLIISSFRTYEAFDCIYSILKLKCSFTFDIHVPQTIQAPTPLQPTWEQLNIPHMMFIDMLPWPTLRRKLILAIGVMDDYGFMADMNSDQLRVWGATPWDPMSWEISEQFWRKWWFLLDENILRTTNFWRRQRHESELTFPEHSLTDDRSVQIC